VTFWTSPGARLSIRRSPDSSRAVSFGVWREAYTIFQRFIRNSAPSSPVPDDVAKALARETGSRVQIAGARAANALGLSTQVPAKSTYLTDGPSRRVVLDKRVVDLRHASPKHLIAPGSAAGTVVQALRHVGAVRARDVAQIAARRLSASDKKTLASTAVQAPAWMRPTLV
jgi:hypothetical protein